MAAPRANWKGYLRLSLVSCPVAVYPATSESEKVRFNQLNRNTGNRIRYVKVDAIPGEEVDTDDIVKGYQVSKGRYIEITDEDLEAVSVQSTRTIDIDQFVPREEINDLYNIRPYYIAPEGKVGAEAFVTIREAIASTGKVALGRIVLSTREHVIMLEARGKGLVGTLLRYPYEVREETDCILHRSYRRAPYRKHPCPGVHGRSSHTRAFNSDRAGALCRSYECAESLAGLGPHHR